MTIEATISTPAVETTGAVPGNGSAEPAKDAAYWETEAKKAFAARDAVKAKVKELEPLAAEAIKARDAARTDAERAAALATEVEKYKTVAEENSAAVQRILDARLANVPDAVRKLVPQGSPAAQLAWIEDAAAAGIFGTAAAPAKPSPGAELPGATGGATITKSVLAGIPPGEKRNAIMQAIRLGKVAVVEG